MKPIQQGGIHIVWYKVLGRVCPCGKVYYYPGQVDDGRGKTAVGRVDINIGVDPYKEGAKYSAVHKWI